MAVWGALKGVHDLAFGSKDLKQRPYEQFVQEARVIGESLSYEGSKISWLPGKIPSYDVNHKIPLLGISLQGTVRRVKGLTPGFVAESVKSSQNAIEWSVALLKHEMKEVDKDIFMIAQKAFANQARLYYGVDGQAGKTIAVQNYDQAAANLVHFIYRKEVEDEFKELQLLAQKNIFPKDLQVLVQAKQISYATKEWFPLLNPDFGIGKEINDLLKTLSKRAAARQQPVQAALSAQAAAPAEVKHADPLDSIFGPQLQRKPLEKGNAIRDFNPFDMDSK